MARGVVEWLLFVVGLLPTIGLPYLVWRLLGRGRPSTVPRPLVSDGDGGWTVPLVAAFGGLRRLAWVALSSNNLSPRLVVRPHGIVCKVLRERTYADGDIETVDVRMFGATVNLCFAFRGSAVTFAANVGSLVLAAEVLRLLRGRVPLSARATALADTGRA